MKDKATGKPLQVSPTYSPITGDGALDFDDVMQKFDQMMDWLAGLYVNTLNLIHYMHDKYSYEALEMALHDTKVRRFFATGIAGLSCAADSLSAIRYAKVYPIRNEDGIVTDFRIEGDYPKYGNNDDRADEIAKDLVKRFMKRVGSHYTYRDSVPTMSILTITSNVVYGKKTGATPDGRHAGEPLAPGANPMHGRDTHGALASLESVAKIPYEYARDGISNTFSATPSSLGKTADERVENLVHMIDGYVHSGGYHLNVNVFCREMLLDAQKHGEVSSAHHPRQRLCRAVHKLTKEQQDEVISRTIHERM